MQHRLLFFVVAFAPIAVAAQGISTSGVRGHVRADAAVQSARVLVRNEATGFSVAVPLDEGRFLVEGLEPGGPYTIRITALGFAPHELKAVNLQLGELRDIDVMLRRVSVVLDTVTVSDAHESAESSGGVGMRIDQAMLERLPTLNRDFYDFVRLVPQISTKISLANPGLSAGGVGFRFNNFLINGVSDRTLGGGVSNTFGGVRSIPLDAVSEYQVLLSPYDVRYGDFAGALINAVTRSGTNELRGSAFVYARNDNLGRAPESSPYDRIQYGLTVGGPVIRDRLHFFVSAELQRLRYPAAGPFVGQSAKAPAPVPISNTDFDRFATLMNAYGLSAGSATRIENSSPLQNLFAQSDLAIPKWNSRATMWINFGGSDERAFSRAAALRDTFSLSSSIVTRHAGFRSAAVRFNTIIARGGGAHNELLLSGHSDRQRYVPDLLQSIVRVSAFTLSGGRMILNTGTPEIAQNVSVKGRSAVLKDNFTLPVARNHLLTLGAELERFRIVRGGAPGSFGTWNFASLDDFALGIVDRYDVRVDFGTASTPLNGKQYAMFAGDQWDVTSALSITAGLRADKLVIDDRAPFQRPIDSIFGRRTDAGPAQRIELSPRAGFVWQMSDRQKVRGGLGLFTTRYPLAWIQTTLSSYGVGGMLTCARGGSPAFAPPAFIPDYTKAPTVCGGGFSITPATPGDVDLVDSNLRMMRVARGSIAHDIELARGIVMSNELMMTRALSDFVFVNLNLAEPVATDLQGRVMYGTLQPNGTLGNPILRISPNTEVIDVQNTSRNRSYQFATKIEKHRSSGIGGSMSYTFSRVRDVQTPTRVNTSGKIAWAAARVISGRHDKLEAGISSNDIPHRVVLQGIYGLPWSAGRTEFAFYYIGESGRPFTYLAFGTLPGRGDLNADRSNTNDPVYVPRNALDTAEIRFNGISDSSVAAQAQAFENFIQSEKCMREQRGKILERNTCREPWSNTTLASITHQFKLFRQSFEAQVEAFNLLNLVNKDWGLRREAIPALLDHVGQTSGTAQTSKPIFRYDKGTSRWSTQQVESAFQLQVALRYRF